MKIKQEQIDAAFAAAGDNKEIIAVLESLFGKRETVKFKHYTDIKTYEDACEYLGINPLPEDCSCTFTSSVDYKPTSDEIAYAKLKIIAKAIRGGEDFSFKKAIENGKYYRPWWIVCSKKYFETQLTDEERERGFLFGGDANSGADAGFACADVYTAPSSTYAYIGSRLCFYDRERCEYFCKQFKELIAEFNFIGCE